MLPRLIPIQQEMSKSFFTTFLGALLIAGHGAAGSPNATSPTLSPDAIFKRYKAAVVRIEVSLHGASLGVGSGFFINGDGEIATSLHVVRPYLIHPQTEIRVQLASGRQFQNVSIGACGDSRGVDLCLLKIDHKPSVAVPLGLVDVTPGESIVAIGHPRGLDFSISTGIVSALRAHPAGWREIQIDAAISPGNSGGPIINTSGEAVGVVYQFERDGQNLNFGILAPEVQSLRAMALPFQISSTARREFLARSKRVSQKSVERSVAPAIASFSNPASRPTGLKWMRAHFTDASFLMLLPELFPSCEKSEDNPDSISTSCTSNGGDIVITIQKRPRTFKNSIAAYHGKRLVEPRPLTLVERLESEGRWTANSKIRSAFYSSPHPAECSRMIPKSLAVRKNGFFEKAAATCRFITENDADAGALSISHWVEVGKDFYGVNIWSSDPGRLPLLQSLSDLVIISAGATSDETVTPYRAKLRAGLQRVNSPTTLAIAGTERIDVYRDHISTVTILKTAPVPPSQMNQSFQKWILAANPAPSQMASPKQPDFSVLETSKSPARTGAWMLSNKRDASKKSLLMMTAIFEPDASWVIYEVQPLSTLSRGTRAPSMDSIETQMRVFRNWTQDFESQN